MYGLYVHFDHEFKQFNDVALLSLKRKTFNISTTGSDPWGITIATKFAIMKVYNILNNFWWLEISDHAVMFVTVAIFWGGTNPLIKRGGAGIENIKSSSKIKQFCLELAFLARRLEVRACDTRVNQSHGWDLWKTCSKKESWDWSDTRPAHCLDRWSDLVRYRGTF